MVRGVAIVLLACAVAAACAAPAVFFCGSDADCSDHRLGGTCEASSFCSFPDPACPSGARYGEFASPPLAGDCVNVESESGGSGGIPNPEAGDTGDGPVPTRSPEPDVPEMGDESGEADPPACGDAVVDVGEVCDDGDAIDGDGCNTDCTPSGAKRFAVGLDVGENRWHDRAYAVVAVPGDAFVIAGYTRPDTGGGPAREAFLARVSGQGDVLWHRRYLEPGWTSARFWGIDVDADERLVAVGEVDHADGHDVLIWLLDGDDGEPLDEPYVGGTHGPRDIAYDVAFDPSGGYLATGSRGPADSRYAWTRRYPELGPAGENPPDDEYGPLGGGDMYGFGVAIDGAGNAYITGSEEVDGVEEMFVRSLTADGASRWTVRRMVAGSAEDRGRHVGVAPNGDVIVGGYVQPETDELTAVLGLDPSDGSVRWTHDLDGRVGKVESVGVDAFGGIGVAGTVGPQSDEDAFLLKLAPTTREEVWFADYRSIGVDKALAVAFTSTGDVVAVGYTESDDEGENTLLLKYSP